MARDVTEIKKLIYETMTGDATLVSLLGGVSKIYQQFPPDKASYPSVFYGIIGEESFPFDEDLKESNTTKIIFSIELESEQTNTTESDNIENRLYQLFNGKSFTNTKVLVRFCKRIYYTQYYDSDAKLWKTITRYEMVSSPK